MAPLEGLRVIDMSRILAGPWAGQAFADLGADVIKVESPKGDDTRQWGPPFIERDEDRSAAYFYAANRGKRSICVDFTQADGQDTMRKLVESADVLIENYKVGGLTKYGLDYESLSTLNPKLVYCSITGFGQTGPYASRAGYDYLIQGMSGLMSITGEPDGMPQKVGVAVTDIFAGLYCVIGAQAALSQREKTGKGQHLDISLLDSATSILANQAMNYLSTGKAPERTGHQHPNLVPYQVFSTSDGHIIIATGNDAQFQRLCDVLDLSAFKTDPRFTDNSARVENRTDLIEALEKRTKNWPSSALMMALENAGIPAGPINSVADVFDDPHIQARSLKVKPEDVPGVRNPWKFSQSELKLDQTAPKLGQHTDEILKEIGKR